MAKTATKATTKAKASTTKTTAAPAPAPTAPTKDARAEAKKPTRGPTANRIGRDVIKLERLAHRVEVSAGRREGWGSSYVGTLKDTRAALLKAAETVQQVKVS